MKKTYLTVITLLLLAAAGGSKAYADQTWDFNGTGACGENFSGTFTTNNSGNLTSSSIVGTGGCLSLLSLGQGNQDGDFTNIDPLSTSSFLVSDNPFQGGDDNLFLFFQNSLTPAAEGTVDDLIAYDISNPDSTSHYLDEYGDHVGVVGSATAVPEPGTLLLLGASLLGLGGAVKRRFIT